MSKMKFDYKTEFHLERIKQEQEVTVARKSKDRKHLIFIQPKTLMKLIKKNIMKLGVLSTFKEMWEVLDEKSLPNTEDGDSDFDFTKSVASSFQTKVSKSKTSISFKTFLDRRQSVSTQSDGTSYLNPNYNTMQTKKTMSKFAEQ